MSMWMRGRCRSKRPRDPGHGSDGFTIIELIIALVILTVALIGMAGVIGSIGLLQTQALSRRVMTELADSKLEEMRASAIRASPDTIQLALGGSLTTLQANHADSVQSARGQWFYRRWQVTAGPAGAREVTLRVQPKRRASGTLYWLDFSTYIVILQ